MLGTNEDGRPILLSLAVAMGQTCPTGVVRADMPAVSPSGAGEVFGFAMRAIQDSLDLAHAHVRDNLGERAAAEFMLGVENQLAGTNQSEEGRIWLRRQDGR
jgi:hypothetical protein